MSKRVSVSGSLIITPSIGTSVDKRAISLGQFGSTTTEQTYDQGLDGQQVIATAGNPGDAFVDLAAAGSLSEVHLLQIRSSAETIVRLYAVPAYLQATAGVFPTGFGGGETVTITLDGTAVITTFDALSQTADDCATLINMNMVFAGFPSPIATVVNGQIRLDGVATAVGASGIGQISVAAGAPATTLGLTATPVDAQGQDVAVNGLYLHEFPRVGSNILTAVQVSGQATLDVIAAGRG